MVLTRGISLVDWTLIKGISQVNQNMITDQHSCDRFTKIGYTKSYLALKLEGYSSRNFQRGNYCSLMKTNFAQLQLPKNSNLSTIYACSNHTGYCP